MKIIFYISLIFLLINCGNNTPQDLYYEQAELVLETNANDSLTPNDEAFNFYYTAVAQKSDNSDTPVKFLNSHIYYSYEEIGDTITYYFKHPYSDTVRFIYDNGAISPELIKVMSLADTDFDTTAIIYEKHTYTIKILEFDYTGETISLGYSKLYVYDVNKNILNFRWVYDGDTDKTFIY